MLADKKIIHVSTGPRMYTQFRMPMIKRQREVCRELLIYCPRDVQTDILTKDGYSVHTAPVTNRPGVHTLFEIARLYRFLKSNRFDILIAHQPMGALVGIIAGRLAGVPVRIYSTGGLKYSPDRKGLFNLAMKHGELQVIRWSSAAFLVNREDEALLKAIPSVRDKACYVGPRGGCGVDAGRFNSARRTSLRARAREELGVGDDVFLAGYVGRCVWEKGFRELVDAAGMLAENERPGCRTVFAVLGKGRHLDEVQGYVESKGLSSRFMFLGYRFDVDYYMSAFDVYVLPSYREGLPVALLEAMCFGLPCIATDIRGSRELIPEGKGILVPPRDARRLADAIGRLASDAGARAKMAEEAERYIHENFEEGLLVDRMMKMVEDITAARFGVQGPQGG